MSYHGENLCIHLMENDICYITGAECVIEELNIEADSMLQCKEYKED